jgi:hypothetical protein
MMRAEDCCEGGYEVMNHDGKGKCIRIFLFGVRWWDLALEIH